MSSGTKTNMGIDLQGQIWDHEWQFKLLGCSVQKGGSSNQWGSDMRRNRADRGRLLMTSQQEVMKKQVFKPAAEQV